MAEIIDVVFKPHGITVFLDDDTKVDGIYQNKLGKPRLLGISTALRTKIINYYEKATPSSQADARFIAGLRSSEIISKGDHLQIDHTNQTGVAGGAAGGTFQRVYFPLMNAKLADSGYTSITGSTSPRIESTGGSEMYRIAWPVGNSDTISLSTGLPFTDLDTSGKFSGAFNTTDAGLSIVLSQSGTEFLEGSITVDWDFEGGGINFGFTLGPEWPLVGTPTTRAVASISISNLLNDLPNPVSDFRQITMTLKPSAGGTTTDTLYFNGAYVTFRKVSC